MTVPLAGATKLNQTLFVFFGTAIDPQLWFGSPASVVAAATFPVVLNGADAITVGDAQASFAGCARASALRARTASARAKVGKGRKRRNDMRWSRSGAGYIVVEARCADNLF